MSGWERHGFSRWPATRIRSGRYAGFAGSVVVEAGPGVVLGAGDEATGDRIAVDVLELLGELVRGEDVEVVVAGLPEVVSGAFELARGLLLEGP